MKKLWVMKQTHHGIVIALHYTKCKKKVSLWRTETKAGVFLSHSMILFIWQYPVNSQVTTLLTLDTVSKNPDFYEIETNTHNLIVKNATYNDDGTFECEAGTSKKTARVYIYGK